MFLGIETSSFRLQIQTTNEVKLFPILTHFIYRIRNNLEDPDSCYMKVNITCAKTKFLRLYKDSKETSSMMILGDDCGYVN